MKTTHYIILSIIAAWLRPGAVRASEFFDGVTPVTQGVIDITNDKLLFSDVSEAIGSRAKNITPLMLRTELHLTPGTDIQAFSTKLAAIGALANGSGVLTNNGSGAFSYTTPAGTANLTTTAAPSTVTVVSDTGTDSVIAAADGTNAGLLLPAEKTKLAGIAAGATVNSADATLLARANHTGTQTLSTISDAGSLAALSAVDSAHVTDSTLVNADISASAAIALSKLATDPLARANHTGYQGSETITPTVVKTSATTITLTSADAGKIYNCTAASAVALTLPVSPVSNFSVTIVQRGAGIITIAAGSGTTTVSYGGALKTAGAGATATVNQIDTTEMSVAGNLVP